MHQKNPPLAGRFLSASDESDEFIDLERLAAIGVRRARVIALCAFLGLLLGVLYLVFTPPEYTAVTDVLIDDSLAKYAQDSQPQPAPMQADSLVASEVEIMKSERLARSVIAAEKLDQDDAFLNPPLSPIRWAKAQVTWLVNLFLPRTPGSGLSPQEARIRKAIQILQDNLDAERIERSYVIEFSYSANDRQLAGRIARAYANAYLSDQLDANFDATERATMWLQGRIADLRASSQAAALDVEKFRAAHGLTAASGELISDQQLSDLNKQLILAQADTANALARYSQFKAIVDSGPDNAVRNATIPAEKSVSNNNTDIINGLKARYLDISKREQEIAGRFGENHPQAVALRAQEADLAKQIYQELRQLTESYHNEYEVAKAREDSLRANVELLSGQSSKNSQAMVQLRELQQKADALSALYQNFLSRHGEAAQQRSFPIAKARVISEAVDPITASSPKKALVLGLSLVLGLFAGAGIGGLQEFRERFFRTGEDVRTALNVNFFGYLPTIAKKADGQRKARRKARDEGSSGEPEMPHLLRFAAEAPSSAFAETLRNAKLASDIVLSDRRCKVISFISVLPREGKTTAAVNFAELLAAGGARTLLIDGDLRNPGLSRGLRFASDKGLVEALIGEQPWQNVILVIRKTCLAIIPAIVRRHLSHTSELLSGPGMRNLIAEAKNCYDYIVVDLPPFGPVVDAKAFEPLVDGFVLVSEWGATPRALVRNALQAEPQITAKVLGIILNKTDMKKLARYGAFGSSEQYLDRYSSYYRDHAGPHGPA